MSYRSAAIVAIVVPLWWALSGAGCSDSGNSGSDPDASVATGGGPVTTCASDKECRDLNFLCDVSRHVCVQCLSVADCPESDASVYECNAGSCVSYMACTNSLMCPSGQVCDKQRSRCVECTQDGDCGMGGKCVDSQCRTGCTSDKDCRAANQLCDPATGTCATCLATRDCPMGMSCLSGSCKTQLCTPGATSCLGGGIAICSANGEAWENGIACDTPCTVVGGVASCGGVDGGISVVSPPVEAGSAGGCGDMIDDMEDHDGYICRGNGRVGQWYTYGSNITPLPPGPPPTVPVPPALVFPPRGASTYAMHLIGSSLTTVTGSALGVDLQLDGATYGTYDAGAYSGISFYGRGNVAIDVLVDSAPTTSPAIGGTCASICTSAQSSLVLSSVWTLYRIPFDTFLGGNGGLTPIDKRSLTHFQFRVASAVVGTDVWIDDLSFFR